MASCLPTCVVFWCSGTVAWLIVEKETKIRESLKMMGVHTASLFASLVSCGMPTMPMVSVAGLTGTSPEMPAVARRWGQVYAKAAGMTLRWTPGAAP